MANTLKLSVAQKQFLREFARAGYRMAPGGYAGAGRDASAYYRTESSLRRMGLVSRVYPDSWTKLTWLGLAWTVAILRGEA